MRVRDDMLIDKLREIYEQSKKPNKDTDEEILKEAVERQYAKLVNQLTVNAEQGISSIRIITSTIHPKTVKRFKEEGFIVWENSEVTLIQIPLSK